MKDKNLRKREFLSFLFKVLCFLSAISSVVFLLILLISLYFQGAKWLDYQFLTSFPSRFPHKAGIKSALWGSIWLIFLTALFSIPVGVTAAYYLEEMAKKNKITYLLDINISNLAGIPSIIYGMLGLVIFVRTLALGKSLLAGALTMALLILPIIIVASREAIKSYPRDLRLAVYSLGANKWHLIVSHIFPYSVPGILTSIILAISRALGETAPLIMIGALTFVAFVPESIHDPFTVLPIQVFNWASRPQKAFHELAAAGILVLLVILFATNSIAVVLRHYWRAKKHQ